MATSVPDARPAGNAGKTKTYEKRSHLVPNVHSMDHRDRGYAVIINNKKFIDLAERTGTDVDRDAMKQLLISMGFQESHIIIGNDCDTNRMKEIMEEVADKYKKSDYDPDCFVAVILSHGNDVGNIVGDSEDDLITVDQLTTYFRGTNCKPLSGKPKIFFFQMCRGEETEKGVPETGHDAQEDEVIEMIVPSEAEFLLAFSVVPGYLSWRNEVRGSWFIQAVVEVFRRNEQWRTEDLLSMLTEVNKVIAYDYGNEDVKQMPCFNSMLTKKVIFSDKPKALRK